MTGVEILSSKEVASNFSFNWTAFWIVAAILFVICLIIYLCTVWEVEVIPWTIAMIGIWIFISVLFGGLFGGVICPTATEYTTEYKVCFEADIDMNDFTEKYEIIDQEGKIFTIRERD